MSNVEEILRAANSNRYYTFKFKLLSDEKKEITFRPLKVGEQKVLVVDSKNGTEAEKILALIKQLNNCIQEDNFVIEDMYVQDFIWLMINFRMKSKGEILDLTVYCDKCKHVEKNFQFDLDKDLEVKYAKGRLKKNTIKVTDNLYIHLDLPRMKHLINKKIEDKETLALELYIDEIKSVELNGEHLDLSRQEKKDMLDGFNSLIIKEFNKFEESNDFGVTMKIEHECKKCKTKNTINVGDNIIGFF